MASWGSRDGADFELMVGRNLKAARKAAGLTRNELANALGVKPQHLGKIEAGENRLTAGRLLRAAKLLKLDLNFFCDGCEPSDNGNVQSSTPVWDSEAISIVRLFKEIEDPDIRERLTDLMVVLAR